MALKNQWVGYISRSYLQIKNSVLQRLSEIVPEVTDHSESNILVIIIGIFSGIAEMLNYYIDNMTRESFITTARRYSSVVKHTRLIDYRIKSSIPSSVDINLSFTDLDNNEVPSGASFVIPKGTIFNTENNIQFLSVTDTKVNEGDKNCIINAQQKTFVDSALIGQTDGSDDQVFSLGSNYVHNSMVLEIDSEPWLLVNTLGRSEPEDKHYIVDISVEKIAYIKFGDNINGKKPEAGKNIIGSYYTTLGSGGNVDANTINQTNFDFSNILGFNVPKVIISNKLKAVAGTDYEDIERIRRSAPLHLRTLERAVTEQDYIDIAMLSPGVDKANLSYKCGKYIDIYISPNGGGIAQSALLQSTKDYFSTRKMITTFVNILPAGESFITLDLEVTAKFRMDGIQTKKDIVDALMDYYSYNNSDINRKIRKSDIISLVDNLYKVDYLTLNGLYLKPYIRPVNHQNTLLYNIDLKPGNTTKKNWKLQFDGSNMRLYNNQLFVGDIAIGQTYTDPSNSITILISDNNYEVGQEWVFVTYPINENIETDDFSIPVIREQDIKILVNEQLSI